MTDFKLKPKIKKIEEDCIKRTKFPIKVTSSPSAKYEINGKEYRADFFTNGVSLSLSGRIIDIIRFRSDDVKLTYLSVFIELLMNSDYCANYVKVEQETIAANIGLSVKTVWAAINWLDENGFIDANIKKGKTGEYIINHNYGIRGSYSTFISNYLRLYPDAIGDNVIIRQTEDIFE